MDLHVIYRLSRSLLSVGIIAIGNFSFLYLSIKHHVSSKTSRPKPAPSFAEVKNQNSEQTLARGIVKWEKWARAE